MNCVFGPYQINTTLEALGQNSFVDKTKTYRVAVISDCSDTVSPCSNSILIHSNGNCPNGQEARFYECSYLGRVYTILIGLCGVTITSFENGLIGHQSDEQDNYGTSYFCFGQIYSSVGTFESSDKSIVSFEFDGNTFTIKGNIGTCPDELTDCSNCNFEQSVLKMENIPTPPADTIDPEFSSDIVEDEQNPPDIQPIPVETKLNWAWSGSKPFGIDTLCEDEKSIANLPECFSHDNPAIAILQSGHAVIAYENRGEDGITKISLAIVASSIKQNVRYYRKLSTGVLLNNLVESQGVGSFEVYDEINIPVDSTGKPGFGEQLGFLNGPLAGYSFPVTKISRTVDGSRVKNVFNFNVSQTASFKDKNNVHDVKWFLLNNQGSANLPSNANLVTILDLPHHTVNNEPVPVSNPSIAVAMNNVMSMLEQNIYIAYQAFEDNQWRVYVREILLGTDGSTPPIYLSPYLFDDSQRSVEILASNQTARSLSTGIFDEDFTAIGASIGQRLEWTSRWVGHTDWLSFPIWTYKNHLDQDISQTDSAIFLCSGSALSNTSCTDANNPNSTVCLAVHNGSPNETDSNVCNLDVTSPDAQLNSRSFYRSNIEAIDSNTGNGHLDVTMKLRFMFVIHRVDPEDSTFPEIWAILGQNSATDSGFGERWKIQITRGHEEFPVSSGTIYGDTASPTTRCRMTAQGAAVCSSPYNCFSVRLYDGYRYGLPKDSTEDRTTADGSQSDTPIRELVSCVGIHDYVYDIKNVLGTITSPDPWNEITINTYTRGQKRVFEIYLNNANTTDLHLGTFVEDDPSISWDTAGTQSLSMGPIYGFGTANTNHVTHVVFDKVTLTSFDADHNPLIFYEDDTEGRLGTNVSFVSYASDDDGSPKTSRYLFNPATAPSVQSGWTYARMVFCQHHNYPYSFYSEQNKTVFPFPHTSGLTLSTANNPTGCYPALGYPPHWGYTSIRVPSQNKREDNQEIYNVSMVTSVERTMYSHNGAWPHVTFVMRLNSHDEDWWSGYRIRISRFTATANYASGTQSNQSVRPSITTGDKYWRIQYFDGETFQSGLITDNVTEEAWLKIGTDTNIDWQDFVYGYNGHTVPYFKVNITEQSGSETRFDIYVGTSYSAGLDIEGISFQLLHTFQVPSIVSRNTGTYYGIAIHDGSSSEFELDNDDYLARGRIDYLRLSTIGSPTEETGACCRATGGCDADVVVSDCQSPDIFYVNTTCNAADCTATFPTGAACNSSGFCLDEVTESFATLQGYGSCSGCEWQEGVDCTTRSCPAATVTGSCCRPYCSNCPTSVCINNLTFDQCKVYFGNSSPFNRWRANSTCSGCPLVADGACCSPSGCSIAREGECSGIGGTFQGIGTDCVSDPCEGACCNGTTCSQATQDDCLFDGFTFLGYGISCTPNPCTSPAPTGVCCLPNGDCIENVVEASCVNGDWSQGLTCNTCYDLTVTGACCDSLSGVCEDAVTESDCTGSGRSYQGDLTQCDSVTCIQPTGACCSNLVCTEGTTYSDCMAINGTYLGNFTHCITDICLEALGIVTGEDPYASGDFVYKPEDMWRIEVDDDVFVTRVKYHMQEEKTVSSVGVNSTGDNSNFIDFMFLVDHSSSMAAEILKAQLAIPTLADSLIASGFNVRFGLVIFGRGNRSPVPDTLISCGNSKLFNGLQNSLVCENNDVLDESLDQGFTRNHGYLQKALNCWGIQNGYTSPWAAINYAILDDEFSWRSYASKYIFFVSDAEDEQGAQSCGGYSNNKQTAKNNLISNGIVFIPAVDPQYNSVYSDVALDSGWKNDLFDVNSENYEAIFSTIVNSIDTDVRVDKSTVMERSESGTSATFLKKAEVIITYDGDLTDLWTFNKADLEFRDTHVPFSGTPHKGLTNLPFELAPIKVYGIDPVHIQGIPENWVVFGNEGPLLHQYPDVGSRASAISSPILISTNSTRPKIFVNNRNQVIVAYENYNLGLPQIEIKGTGDFHQDSITGAKATRIQRFLVPEDFYFSHSITLPSVTPVEISEYGVATISPSISQGQNPGGINQMCDFVIDNNDVTHIVWQSNASGYWEIYYANSGNLFSPVRITKVKSRSSSPSISINENGVISVVYHDDRFGPFEIMMSIKNEERTKNLLEQDAYMASLRNKYIHYTNILPVFLDNPSNELDVSGQFWATIISSGLGNSGTNALYKLSESTGIPSDSTDTGSNQYVAIAFSSSALYAISPSGTLFKVGDIDDTNNFEPATSPTEIGDIRLAIDGFENPAILDMTVDAFDRIWVLIYEKEISGGGGVGVGTASVYDRLRIEQVSPINATTLSYGLFTNNQNIASNSSGSIAVTSDNNFYITFRAGSNFSVDSSMAVSSYPSISDGVANFNFTVFDQILESVVFVAMDADVNDTLYAITSSNDLYTIDKFNADKVFVAALTTGSDAEVQVGETSGLAYHLIQNPATVTNGEFFHIRVDFYDNIALEGSPVLMVDSRENLEAFINEQILDDPYAIQGMDARGIYLQFDEIGIVFFDASHFVPGSRLSQPYTFEPNQTYFPKVYLIKSNGELRLSGIKQTNSFSCTKCSRFGNNNFNNSSCSYSFVATNGDSVNKFYNFQVDFYADQEKRFLIRRFDTSVGHEDLQYFEVDNRPALELWNENGLNIRAGESPFIQVYPTLDPQAGFLCGVQYTVQVNQCFSEEGACSDFSLMTSSNWVSNLVNNNIARIKTDLTNEIIPGMSMAVIGDKLGVAWRSTDNNLHYAEFNGVDWVSQAVITSENVRYVYLTSIQNRPAISFTTESSSVNTENVIIRVGTSWNYVGGLFENENSNNPFNPRAMIEYQNSPLTVFATSGGVGQGTFTIPGNSLTFDTESSCDYGSCIFTLQNINENPSIAYIANSHIKYAVFSGSGFSETQNIQDLDVPYFGRIGLADVGGLPAVAYIKRNGNLGELVYRKFNGSSWDLIDTNVGIQDFNKHIAMATINGNPIIVYSIKDGDVSQLNYSWFNGSSFENGIIDESIDSTDPLIDIVEFLNNPAVVVSANPFRVYYFRQRGESSIDNISKFYCECSSQRFIHRLSHLHELGRWDSSAFGSSDTRITDSPKNSINPIIKTKINNTAVIVWEDFNKTENCSNPPCIRAATFRDEVQDQLKSSGTKSWFDYDFGISGQDPNISIDQFDRTVSVYEKLKAANSSGFYGKGISKLELPQHSLYCKVCDFIVDPASTPVENIDRKCDISNLESNIVSFDQFISSKIVKKIKIKEKHVNYYTYNASGVLTPIVSTCNLALEIHGTPEIVAIRIKNENDLTFSSWCPWSPQISDFVMEKSHKISGGSGIKEICVQAMTYIGITTQFCIPVIADYQTVIFETRFYKDTDIEGNKITNFDSFPADLDSKLVHLPTSDGVSVASLIKNSGTCNISKTPCSKTSDCPSGELCQSTVFVEIIPNDIFAEETILFDVIQQGVGDIFDRVAKKGRNNSGKVMYRGEFTIEREDHIFNIDGLARINPTFPSSCEELDTTTAAIVSDTYVRDRFNVIGIPQAIEDTEISDPLAIYRQSVSGRIGVTLDIRSNEDPYFVFGDPNYSIKAFDGVRFGVPFISVERDVIVQGSPNQQGELICEPIECTNGEEFNPLTCRCEPPSG